MARTILITYEVPTPQQLLSNLMPLTDRLTRTIQRGNDLSSAVKNYDSLSATSARLTQCSQIYDSLTCNASSDLPRVEPLSSNGADAPRSVQSSSRLTYPVQTQHVQSSYLQLLPRLTL